MNNTENEHKPVVNLCVWCGKKIIEICWDKKLICAGCYKTLSAAGVSEEEILAKTSSTD